MTGMLGTAPLDDTGLALETGMAFLQFTSDKQMLTKTSVVVHNKINEVATWFSPQGRSTEHG
jgi:hypothetical protein